MNPTKLKTNLRLNWNLLVWFLPAFWQLQCTVGSVNISSSETQHILPLFLSKGREIQEAAIVSNPFTKALQHATFGIRQIMPSASGTNRQYKLHIVQQRYRQPVKIFHVTQRIDRIDQNGDLLLRALQQWLQYPGIWWNGLWRSPKWLKALLFHGFLSSQNSHAGIVSVLLWLILISAPLSNPPDR